MHYHVRWRIHSSICKVKQKTPPEVLSSIAGIEDLSKLSDSIAAHMTLRLEEKQKFLNTLTQKIGWNTS